MVCQLLGDLDANHAIPVTLARGIVSVRVFLAAGGLPRGRMRAPSGAASRRRAQCVTCRWRGRDVVADLALPRLLSRNLEI